MTGLDISRTRKTAWYMREFIKSVVSFSLAVPLFAIKQLSNTLQAKEEAPDPDKAGNEAALDAVTRATEAQLAGPIKSVFKGGDKLQRDLVDRMFDSLPTDGDSSTVTEQEAKDGTPEGPVDAGQLDKSVFIALGEGLAAGVGDFGLSAEFQSGSFPALLALQMQTEFTQPLVEAPGIGAVPGFDDLPVIVPALMQNTALDEFPPRADYANLSVPSFRVCDAHQLRPIPPLVHRGDHKQTAANLILGGSDLIAGKAGELSTQLECALRQKPTVALLELGYYEIVEAAVKGDPAGLPDVDTFRDAYAPLLKSLREAGSQVVVMTIPDPQDTAYLSTVESAAGNLKIDPSLIYEGYDLNPGDRVTVSGLVDMGCQLLTRDLGPLPAGSIVPAAVVGQISTCVQALNAELATLAETHGALVYDLHGFLHQFAEEGANLGLRQLSADFLGGFYQLNGHYPGLAGHALIANEVLELLNEAFGAAFPLVNVEGVLDSDPVASYRQAEGPDLALDDLSALTRPAVETLPESVEEIEVVPVIPFEAAADDGHGGHTSRLTLPSDLEQTLPLSKSSSYYGDAIRAVNCRTEQESQFGSGRELLFGGLAMLDSHLHGHIHIKFTEPVDDITHFEVSLGEGLVGDDGVMTAPQFFKLPAQQNSVADDADLISSGDLDLATGEVTNLDFAFRFFNTALLALVRCNPKFPDVPIKFPGMYGSASARFEQRPDGKLDFTFQGTTFIPLGMALDDPVRFPLPFCSPALEYASIPGHGTTLHPHIHLSTSASAALEDESNLPDIPVNEIREYTIHAHNTSFGDKFHLTAPELVGDPTGRSQLMGRVQVQFGQRFGDSVSVAISHLNPGGLLTPDPGSPLGEDFPGRLPPAPIGHNEFLRFSQRTYYLDSLTCIDDPFDFCVGAVNVKTGKVLGELLHRALIGQNVFYALVRLEPRTPKESFYFQGPALFEKDSHGQTIFRFRGQVTIPYPEGNLFPAPDLATTFTAGPDSVLDPFLWVQAMDTPEAPEMVKKGEADQLVSSASEVFSYRYEIPGAPDQHSALFEYTNHTQNGTYRLDSLAWVSFTNSRESQLEPGDYDTVTFAGFGCWDKNDVQNEGVSATVQVSTAAEASYVSIQIGAAVVSNVNTKPEDIDEVRP